MQVRGLIASVAVRPLDRLSAVRPWDLALGRGMPTVGVAPIRWAVAGSTHSVGASDQSDRQTSDSFGCLERVLTEGLQMDLGAEQSGREPFDDAPLPRGDGIEHCTGG